MQPPIRLITLSAGLLISALATHSTSAQTFDTRLSLKAAEAGFLTPSNRRGPTIVSGGSGDLVADLCSRKLRKSASCPPSESGGQAGGIDDYAAKLPHLRLDIILRDYENVVVAGSGVDTVGHLGFLFTRFKIESTSADVSVPTIADSPSELPLPAPGTGWYDLDSVNMLYRGVIHNGCLGPATFDLTLDSSIYRFDTGVELGAVHLTDSVDGHGYYNFKYTIRATDEYGNVSDLVYSGDADAYCTGQAGL